MYIKFQERRSKKYKVEINHYDYVLSRQPPPPRLWLFQNKILLDQVIFFFLYQILYLSLTHVPLILRLDFWTINNETLIMLIMEYNDSSNP